jgi:hypothetical protein
MIGQDVPMATILRIIEDWSIFAPITNGRSQQRWTDWPAIFDGAPPSM